MRFQAPKIFLFASALAPTLLASSTPSLVESNSTTTKLAATAKEEYCHLNLHYCGWNLINNFGSDYRTRISNKLCALTGDCNINSANIWNSLWNCGADLEFLGVCGGDYSCQNGGAGYHDYCQF
ncbi:hypothetical protein F5Y08DRAFT_352013 [Xylaria arbuscula]|nr:hypothetical protein F5Y08DRAFT_352013 [Xylaria arbuscula]